MDETRAVSESVVFFSVGLGLLAQFFYVHDLWSLFHLFFYALLTAITIKENGGLKILISGLDNWVAEIATHRNRVLIVKSTNKSIDTHKTNFADTEIDLSQGDTNIITDDDKDEIEDELLPPPETSTAVIVIVFCFVRLLLLPSSPSSSTAIFIVFCFVRLLLLPSSSSSASWDFLYLPSSSSNNFLYLPSSSTAIYFKRLLLSSSSTSTIVVFCFVRHLLLRVTSTTITICFVRHLLSSSFTPYNF
ncbi:hypothetical protein CDAR_426231 [Caerostris darwini]|uniref:Transmembrane protein n=1 Tax=Caerostris darwini TaxID=1538125 RepID=A0AAV4NGG6_9ARAC|nr:hypothetical protein CDAR_426231 [Caerostris darwini]